MLTERRHLTRDGWRTLSTCVDESIVWTSQFLKKKALLLQITTFVLLAIVLQPKDCVAAKEDSAERQRGGFVFTASVRNAAFLGRSPQGNQTILLVDYETGKLKRIISSGAHLSSPRLSPDGTRLLLARQRFKERWQQLLSCDLHSFVCKSIVKSEGSIGSPVEITGGRVLYVSSPYDVGYDGRGRYALNDFWIVGQSDMPRQLTHMILYQLNSVSVANGEVYFSTGTSSAKAGASEDGRSRQERQRYIQTEIRY